MTGVQTCALPIFTYYDTHSEWRFRVHDLDEDDTYDHSDRAQAFKRVLEIKGKGLLPIGLVLKGEHPSLESLFLDPERTPPALQDIDPARHLHKYLEVMHSFMG